MKTASLGVSARSCTLIKTASTQFRRGHLWKITCFWSITLFNFSVCFWPGWMRNLWRSNSISGQVQPHLPCVDSLDQKESTYVAHHTTTSATSTFSSFFCSLFNIAMASNLEEIQLPGEFSTKRFRTEAWSCGVVLRSSVRAAKRLVRDSLRLTGLSALGIQILRLIIECSSWTSLQLNCGHNFGKSHVLSVLDWHHWSLDCHGPVLLPDWSCSRTALSQV